MKTFKKQTGRLGLGLLGALMLAVTSALTMQPAVGDSTVGSLPSVDGGDGSQSFYLRTPRALLDEVIANAWGDGFYVVVPLPEGEVWLEFYGDVTVVFDRDVLDKHSEIELGLSAGFNGGGMVIVPEVDGDPAGRSFSLDAGFSWATPYDRIEGLLDAPLSFHTSQALTGLRAEVSYLSFGRRLLAIEQDVQN